jgi:hypothetical protein
MIERAAKHLFTFNFDTPGSVSMTAGRFVFLGIGGFYRACG